MKEASEHQWSDWEQKFNEVLQNQPSGAKAWIDLERAGLGDFAKFVLFQSYAFGDPVSVEIDEGLAKMGKPLKKFRYADKVARENPDNPRAQAKREKALKELGDSKWPYPNERAKTLAEAKRAYPVLGAIPLDKAPAVHGTVRQDLQRYGGKKLLVALRAAAKARGVDLSLTQLSELAYAASQKDDPPWDKNTLQRFFALPTNRMIEDAWLRRFKDSAEWVSDPRALMAILEAVTQEIGQIPRINLETPR